jgi:hypothetical protein
MIVCVVEQDVTYLMTIIQETLRAYKWCLLLTVNDVIFPYNRYYNGTYLNILAMEKLIHVILFQVNRHVIADGRQNIPGFL